VVSKDRARGLKLRALISRHKFTIVIVVLIARPLEISELFSPRRIILRNFRVHTRLLDVDKLNCGFSNIISVALLCAVVQQLTRFQLTQRVVRSVCDIRVLLFIIRTKIHSKYETKQRLVDESRAVKLRVTVAEVGISKKTVRLHAYLPTANMLNIAYVTYKELHLPIMYSVNLYY